MIRSRARFLSVTVGAVLAAVALSGCAAGSASSSASPSASATEESEAPSATPPSDAGGASIPTDCNALGTPETREETVGDLNLQSDGEGFVRPAPEGATLALGCDWFVGDTTGVLLLISTATPDAVAAAVADLPSQGYSCQLSEDFGAEFCDLPGEGPDREEMIVAREGVWIYMSTSNRNGRALLSEITQGIFG